MAFTDIFIRRPVFATVLSLIILLIGIRSYFSLPVRLFPKISTSVVTITTNFAGADTELMEGFVTTPIENALGGTDGIDYITSSSTSGSSTITVFFQLGYDINAAIADINSKVNSVRHQLPQDIDDPVISKSDPNAEPTIYINFFGTKNIPVEQITDYLKRVVQPQLQTLPGVGNAQVWGSGYAMRIWLNPELMAAHNVTASDILTALTTQSLQAPSGQLKSAWEEYNVKTASEAKDADQFNSIIIKQSNNSFTRIRDVGKAELGSENSDISVFVNDKPGVVLPITPASNANPLDITKEVNALLPKILKNLPAGIAGTIMWDSSKFIAESINEVKKTILEATLYVILIVFLFIGVWRILIIPAVTIPLSLIGVCGIMYAMNYSLNTITFLGMVLAIGMVVDDAIVMVENIHRHIVAGKSSVDAAKIGAQEIQFAVIAMTFTLAAVYAPIGFLTGLVGSLFKEFAFSLAGAVIISGFIALTLSPMMCSKIMTRKSLEGNFAKKIEQFTEKLTNTYQKILIMVMQQRKLVVALIPVILTICYVLSLFIPSELAPLEDSGFIMVPVLAPTSANIDYTSKYTKLLEPIFSDFPEHQSHLIVNGGGFSAMPNVAFAGIVLTPWSERKRSTDTIIASLFPKLWAIPGVLAFPINPPSLPGITGQTPIQLSLQSIGDYKSLNAVAQKMVAIAHSNPHLVNINVVPKLDKPQIDIDINRDKAGDLGISVQDIGNSINLALGQPTVSHFSILGRRYNVIPQVYPEFSNKPETLNNLYLNTATNTLVPLSNLITINETVQPQSIDHFQQLRSITIQANMLPGYTLGQALSYLQTVAKSVTSKDVQLDYGGMSRQYFQTSGQLLFTFIFAVIFIFLVLAAQFESFRDPLIVLFCIPLSTFGAFIAMLLTGCTLNIYSEIGLVTLVGLISKHGILLVEFANQLQEQGKDIKEAIITSASIRLRPILMTTAAMILGALPLAFASGAGAVSRQQIGWVIIGGMSIGTLFTIFIVPIIYTYLATKKTKIAD
jgi:multidrug efflux pump